MNFTPRSAGSMSACLPLGSLKSEAELSMANGLSCRVSAGGASNLLAKSHGP